MPDYLYRPKGNFGKGWRQASQYHPLREDGKTSLCGGAVNEELGYKIIVLPEIPMRARTCNNCLIGRVVRP